MSSISVDIVNYETIKPSTPTPPRLNTLKLSLMDQLEGPNYVPAILFFSATPTATVNRLKKSLSQTLTLFYPFAGRIVDNQYIHCNDRGVNFFETRVNTQMENVLANPTSDYLLPLIPNHDHKLDPTALLSVQIIIFYCRRMALCAYLTHQVSDTSSLVFFLNTWAAITRGDADAIVPPNFCSSSLFPPGANTHIPEVISGEAQEKLVSKRFVFNASDITALQAKCGTELYRPTRVEAVVAYMWRCAMNAAGTTSSGVMPSVNLRTRMDPPLSTSSVGNLVLGLLATATIKGGALPPLTYLADRLHQEITKVDSNYVRKLQQVGNGVMKLYDSYKQQLIQLSSEGEQEASFFMITSFSRFSFYEADFGWGKPEWATILPLVCPDVIMLLDTRCGTGFEAWVTFTEQRMSKFECNPHLIAFSSKL